MKRVFTLMFFMCVILITVLFSAGEFDKSNKVLTMSRIIRNGDEQSNKLAFACNVDWGSEIIPEMFKIFDDNNIHITFFVTGKWAEKNPSLLREMFIKGHEIGNHGYAHKLCSSIEINQVKEEILKTEQAVENLIGTKTNLFAPPSGDYDERTIEMCNELGYSLILWSVDTIDWKKDSTAGKIRDRVIKKPLNGAIVLMHPKAETVKALPEIIDYIQAQGIEIVPISKLIE